MNFTLFPIPTSQDGLPPLARSMDACLRDPRSMAVA